MSRGALSRVEYIVKKTDKRKEICIRLGGPAESAPRRQSTMGTALPRVSVQDSPYRSLKRKTAPGIQRRPKRKPSSRPCNHLRPSDPVMSTTRPSNRSAQPRHRTTVQRHRDLPSAFRRSPGAWRMSSVSPEGLCRPSKSPHRATSTLRRCPRGGLPFGKTLGGGTGEFDQVERPGPHSSGACKSADLSGPHSPPACLCNHSREPNCGFTPAREACREYISRCERPFQIPECVFLVLSSATRDSRNRDQLHAMGHRRGLVFGETRTGREPAGSDFWERGPTKLGGWCVVRGRNEESSRRRLCRGDRSWWARVEAINVDRT